METTTTARPVHASWDGRATCTGRRGGTHTNPKHDPAGVTCPACREALDLAPLTAAAIV